MGKGGGKSSASSATRKKHARKAAAAAGIDIAVGPSKEKKPKGKDGKKGKGKEPPRKKVFIPPQKPAKPRPDPLDTLGLQHILQPELYIVLRRLGKKDVVTKTRALEELQAEWIEPSLKPPHGDDLVAYELAVEALSQIVPVWLHHLPSLALHPSRRIRHLAGSLHTSLLSISSLRSAILTQIVETSDPELILGAWLILAHDVERSVSASARQSWATNAAELLKSDLTYDSLVGFVQRILLDSAGAWLFVNPPPVSLTPAPASPSKGGKAGASGKGSQQKGAKGAAQAGSRKGDESLGRIVVTGDEDDPEERAVDRRARLRIGALGGLAWILDNIPSSNSTLNSLLSTPTLWTALSHARDSPVEGVEVDEQGCFGHTQPGVRTAAWQLLAALLRRWKKDPIVNKAPKRAGASKPTQAGGTEVKDTEKSGSAEVPNEETAALTLETLLPLLAPAVLRSAWVEPDERVRAAMWGPLLMLLRDYPHSWIIDAEHGANTPEEEDPDTDSEDDEESEEEPRAASIPTQASKHRSPELNPVAYRSFLSFLELGCGGSAATQGYPVIVVVVSTIPASIFSVTARSNATPFAVFTESFWSALPARALSGLDRPAAHEAFLGALLDVLVYLARRFSKDVEYMTALVTPRSEAEAEEGTENVAARPRAIESIVREQVSRVWDALVSRSLQPDLTQAAQLLSSAISSFLSTSPTLFMAAWKPLTQGVRTAVANAEGAELHAVLAVLKSMADRWNETSFEHGAAVELVKEVVESVMGRCESTHGGESVNAYRAMVGVLDVFGDAIEKYRHAVERLENLVQSHTSQLLRTCPPLLLAYISRFSSSRRESTLNLWRSILAATASARDITLLYPVLDAVEAGIIPTWLTSDSEKLDNLLEDTMSLVLREESSEFGTVKRILNAHDQFVSPERMPSLISALAENLSRNVEGALNKAAGDAHNKDIEDPASVSNIANDSATTPSRLLLPVELTSSALFSSGISPNWAAIWVTLLPAVFILSRLLPVPMHAPSLREATNLWEKALPLLDDVTRAAVKDVLQERLAEFITDTSSPFNPESILAAYQSEPIFAPVNAVVALVPRSVLDRLTLHVPSDPISSSLGVDNILIPPPSLFREDNHKLHTAFDKSGWSAYARSIRALIHALSEDRTLSRSNLWSLEHLWTFTILADDWLALPSQPHALFSTDADRNAIQDYGARARRIAAYLASRLLNDQWHANVTSAIQSGDSSSVDDEFGRFIVEIFKKATDSNSILFSRVIFAALQHAFSSIVKEDADRWIVLSRKLEKTAPHSALAVVHAVTRFAPEPSKLDRYRNEMAANLTGVPARKANVDGLWLLHRLAAVAPDPGSDIVFLPQQRAVQLVKACQTWVEADDDDASEGGVDEEVEGAMTLVFVFLAPILQDVIGSHWDFMLDVIENNLENSSFGEDSTLVVLYRTLSFIITLQDLCATNKPLKAIWQERQQKILTAVRNLTALRVGNLSPSRPRSLCRELALSIVQDLPPSFLDEKTLASMSHLISDTSVEVQKMAYQMLQKAARKHTEFMVVEAGVDAEGTYEARLPAELLEALTQGFDSLRGAQSEFAYLLGWMLVFDLYQDASIKVKSGYSDHLRDLDLVSITFLPTIYTMLGIYTSPRSPFKLEAWSVDEYYLPLFDLDAAPSIPLLAAHVYYRALLTVPSLIRSWLDGCKDRQLHLAVTSFTSQYFSKVIVDTELAQVKTPQAIADLTDENLSVKVASNVSEVTAVYTVDEQQLELTLKLPNDWPLHAVEIRDRKPVGVPEDKWRAWVLNIKQMVWSQNGTVLDGLTLFKKNVTLHFQGLVECAICYSIIGVTDGSLPRKPCKTCKNRFHASCLFKWFSSSHSSSCPLCRSEIL